MIVTNLPIANIATENILVPVDPKQKLGGGGGGGGGMWRRRYSHPHNNHTDSHVLLQLKVKNILHLTIYMNILTHLYITPSHFHHFANLSKDIELIKCLSAIFVECISKKKHNMWGCVFSVYSFLLWWLIEYIYFFLLSSSNRKYELVPVV